MQLSRLRILKILLALCVAAGLSLVAAPGASAHSPGRHHVVLSSHARGVSGAEMLGEAWSMAIAQSSFPHCMLLGHGRIMFPDPDAPCAVRAGVPVFIPGPSTAWTNLDPGLTSDPREQARLAIENDHAHVKKLTITIDGRGPINYLTPRFEALSRQLRVWMPAQPDGTPAQEVTFVVHGWGVMVQGLRPGRHLIHTEWTNDFGGELEVFQLDFVLDVLPRHHAARNN